MRDEGIPTEALEPRTFESARIPLDTSESTIIWQTTKRTHFDRVRPVAVVSIFSLWGTRAGRRQHRSRALVARPIRPRMANQSGKGHAASSIDQDVGSGTIAVVN